MQLPGIQGGDDAGLQRLWLQVCQSRGTPAPDPGKRGQFLQDLEPEGRSMLENILALALRGREKPGDLGVLSWAAACTRPALLDHLQAHGLAFTGASLFACGLKLKEDGWDMQQRIAQLQAHPGDVDTLRALLTVGPSEPEADPQALAMSDRPEEAPTDEAFPPWPDDDDADAPGWHGEHEHESPAESSISTGLPLLPTRFERQPPVAPEAFFAISPAATKAEPPMVEPRLRLRLFGKAAAHTLEITVHRRASDFLGVHVVSIDSAHALGAGGGYDWQRKLVLQMTPEEMPAVVATLIGITPSVRFGHHGADRSKFVEVRRQEGGLVVVTGEHAVSYSVPVPTSTVCYMLDLFCRAMAMATPGRSVSDVLMLVKSAHGF